MELVHSFAPVCDRNARVLILGSMPGIASLSAGQYYAHPRNAFWPIVAQITGTAAEAPYAERIRALKRARIALWDVLAACARTGSLDADIEAATIVPNDFPHFFACHRSISHVFFNGTLAETSFRRYVLPVLDTGPLTLVRLPSTSPAHAARSFEQKCAAWSVLARTLAGAGGRARVASHAKTADDGVSA